MLIGALCPIFWLSLLSGTRGDELMFNAVHPLIVVVLGIVYIGFYRISVEK